MDTIDPMVVPDLDAGAPPSGPPAHPRPPAWLVYWWVLPVAVGLLTLWVALDTELPYYAIAPGSAPEVDRLISAPEGRIHPSRGEVHLATVSLQRVKPLAAVRGWLDTEIDVVPEEQILGTTPPDQLTRQNRLLMEDSKETAIIVALRRLGYDVRESGDGALVAEVSSGTPAAGRFAPGDTITAVDGVPTALSQDTIDRIRAHRPGEPARIQVTNAEGTPRLEDVVLGEREGKAFLGVSLHTKNRRYDKPFPVTINSGTIGGPSAGLAFVLGLIDELSPGELTGGHNVAVTGTIALDGTVGDVGGVAQKTAAVRAEGAEYFLVPPGEYKVAKRHAGSRLEVIQVATLDEAIQALGRIGGDIAPAVGTGGQR